MESDFFTYSRQLIAHEREFGNCDVAHNRAAALCSLSKFLGKEALSFSELTPQMMQEFKAWFMTNGRKETTARLYLCQINALYKEAAKAGIATQQQLLKGINLSMPAKQKRELLSEDELRRMRYADLSQSKPQAFARDIFFFSIYCRGISFTDLAHIKKSDINGFTLTYTSQVANPSHITVPWDAAMQEIANRYPSDTDYLFPFIKSSNKVMKSREIGRVRENITRALRQIAHRCGLSVTPSLNMVTGLYQRAINNVRVSQII